MTMQYPVAGYRTAEAARRGFQTFEQRFLSQPFRSPSSPSTRDLELALKQAFRPSAPGTPIRVGPGVSTVPKVARKAAALGTAALTRHPVFRAAQLAWEIREAMTPDPMLAEREEETGLIIPEGWYYCWGRCSDPPGAYGWGWAEGGTVSECGSPSLECLAGQGISGFKEHTTAMASHIKQWYEAVKYVNSGIYRMKLVQHWYRVDNAPQPYTGVTQEAVAPVPYRVPVPMPMPYALIPYQPQTSTHNSGYGEPPAPPVRVRRKRKGAKHRKPGRKEQERKFSLMSGGRLRNVIEAAFEGTEWVQDLHDALPDDCKANGTVAQNFVAVVSCFDRLDMCKAFENRINNHIEDKVIGVLGQFAKKSAIGSGKSYGLAGITKKLGKPYFDENGDLQFDPTLPFSIPKVSLGC